MDLIKVKTNLMKRKKLLVKVVVSALLITIILSNVDKQTLIENFSKLNLAYAPLIVLLLVANYVVSSIRWQNLLIFPNKEKVSLGFLIKLYFTGSFFNNFMPTSIGGDVYKIFKLGQKIDSKANAFSATFMERFTGVVVLVLISVFSMLKILGLYGLLIFVAFWVAAIAGIFSLKFLSKKVKKLAKLYDAIILYKKYPKVLVIALVTSLIVQLASIFTQYLIFSALGYQLDIFLALMVFPLITLASFFIPSLNGIGVQDALYINLIALPTVGLTAAAGLSASIIFHLTRLFVSLAGGVFYALDKD